MSVINSSSFAKALWHGVNAWYGKAYGEYSTEYNKLFETFKIPANQRVPIDAIPRHLCPHEFIQITRNPDSRLIYPPESGCERLCAQ